MKRVWMLLLLMACMASGGQAQMRVFVARDAMDEGAARQLIGLLADAFPQETWLLEMEEKESLDALIMQDRAPQLALCMAQDAMPWAREGMLLPLALEGQEAVQEEVLSCCRLDEELYMVPVCAYHRVMAVNREMLEKKRLGYLLNGTEHPVWYATQFYQVMEEFMLDGETAFEIWPPDAESSAGIEALVQVIGGGALMSGDDQTAQADSEEILAGVRWLSDMVRSGMAGYAPSREKALGRFLEGETAVFIDWTPDMQRMYAERIRESGMELAIMPYPSSIGETTRVFSLAGAAAFDSGDEDRNALALRAAAFLGEDERAAAIAGGRKTGRDDAAWLPDMENFEGGATMRALFARVLRAVLEEGADAEAALSLAQTAMEAAGW